MMPWGMSKAVPAYPEKIQFRQPDGRTQVWIWLKGDERVHWAESMDGYSLVHNDNGALEYAMPDGKGGMTASGLLATEQEERSAEVEAFLKKTPKGLRFSQEQIDELLRIWNQVEDAKSGPKTMTNVLGEKRFLVILFAFQDKPFGHGARAFKNLFNQVNYTANGAHGSVHDYYYAVSGGLFSLKVDVVGPFTGIYNTAHYGNTDNGYQDFAHEAVDSAAQYVDFSNYDNDGDGYIDGLHIIFAGYGEEAGAPVDCIWSHKWNIFNPPTYNNTVVDVYSCSPECKGTDGNILTAIGVICHELGHVFGAPDYYDTDYGQSGGEFPGLGQWDIMSSGSWNRGGIVPANHNPYTKLYIYNWATCDTLNNLDGKHVMLPATRSNSDFYRLNTSTAGDFFLIENRQKESWDSGIPGHGMLVYHVHPSAHGASVSNRKHPQQIYILAHTTIYSYPDGTPTSYGSLNSDMTPLPSMNGFKDSLTDNSVPWIRPWSGVENNVKIKNISEKESTKELFFILNNGEPDPSEVTAEGVSMSHIEVRWNPYGNYSTLVVMNSEEAVFGVPEGHLTVGDTLTGGGIVVYNGNGTRVIVDSLQAGSKYYFKLFSRWNGLHYSAGVETDGTTLTCEGTDWTTENFDNTEIGDMPLCWNGEWTVDSVAERRVLRGIGGTEAFTAPLRYSDTTHGAVLKFSYMLNENSRLRVDFRRTPTESWDSVIGFDWHYGMATWNDAYVFLPEAGDYSRIRFTISGDSMIFAAIDDVELRRGALVLAECDENGDIAPYGYSIVPEGEGFEVTLRALPGYELGSLTLNGTTVDPQLMTTDTNGVTTATWVEMSGMNRLYANYVVKTSIRSAEGESIAVFPNPTDGIVTVVAPEGEKVTLYDAMGRVLLVTRDRRIDLGGLRSGLYLLRCGNEIFKVIKK